MEKTCGTKSMYNIYADSFRSTIKYAVCNERTPNGLSVIVARPLSLTSQCLILINYKTSNLNALSFRVLHIPWIDKGRVRKPSRSLLLAVSPSWIESEHLMNKHSPGFMASQ